jgi:hypothetical protein
MTKHSIYCSDEHLNIDEALKILTDEWVDDGNYSAQTVIDLRDAVTFYMNIAVAMHEKTLTLEREKDNLEMELSNNKLEVWKLEQQIADDYWPGA